MWAGTTRLWPQGLLVYRPRLARGGPSLPRDWKGATAPLIIGSRALLSGKTQICGIVQCSPAPLRSVHDGKLHRVPCHGWRMGEGELSTQRGSGDSPAGTERNTGASKDVKETLMYKRDKSCKCLALLFTSKGPCASVLRTLAWPLTGMLCQQSPVHSANRPGFPEDGAYLFLSVSRRETALLAEIHSRCHQLVLSALVIRPL